MIKFQRAYTLKIGTETGEMIVVKDPLTLDFTVEQANYASLGNAAFQIKNLGDVTRRRVYSDYYDFPYRKPLEFYAGYGAELALIFKGTISEASSFRMPGGVDNVTQVTAYMGAISTIGNPVSLGVEGPTTQIEVIDRLIGSLHPLQKGFVSPGFAIQYPRGRSLCGNAWNLLKQETGGYCFVSNGKVYCMRYGEFLPTDIFLLNSSTGLLGSPRRSKSFVVAEMLFEPRMAVGQKVQLESSDNAYLDGVYSVIGIEHSGTISGAAGGRCTTKISMLVGANPLYPARLVTAGGALG